MGLSQKRKFCDSPLFKKGRIVKNQKKPKIKRFQRTAKRSRKKTAFFFSKYYGKPELCSIHPEQRSSETPGIDPVTKFFYVESER